MKNEMCCGVSSKEGLRMCTSRRGFIHSYIHLFINSVILRTSISLQPLIRVLGLQQGPYSIDLLLRLNKQ